MSLQSNTPYPSCQFARYHLPAWDDKPVSSVDSNQFGQFIPNPGIAWLREVHKHPRRDATTDVLLWVESQCAVLNEGYYRDIETYIHFQNSRVDGNLLRKHQLVDQQRQRAGIPMATKEQLHMYPALLFSKPPISGMLLPESYSDGTTFSPRVQWFTPQPKPQNYHILPRATESMPEFMDPDSLSDSASDSDASHIR